MRENTYLVFVKTGKETKLVNLLNREKNAYDYEAYVFLGECVFRKQGMLYTKFRILFPGYIFIKTSMNYSDFFMWHNMVSRRYANIYYVVSYSVADHMCLSKEIMLFLDSLCDEKHCIRKSTGVVEKDNLVVLDGPLSGMEKYIQKIDRHRREAVVELVLGNEILKIKLCLEILRKTK